MGKVYNKSKIWVRVRTFWAALVYMYVISREYGEWAVQIEENKYWIIPVIQCSVLLASCQSKLSWVNTKSTITLFQCESVAPQKHIISFSFKVRISDLWWRCPWCNGYRRRKWTQRTRVQILDVTDCVSHSTNTLGNCMNPITLTPAMGK